MKNNTNIDNEAIKDKKTFVFDENFSKHLAEGLDLLEKSNPGSKIPVNVISAEILMGRRGATDEEIIAAAGADGVVITKDKDFKQIKPINV